MKVWLALLLLFAGAESVSAETYGDSSRSVIEGLQQNNGESEEPEENPLSDEETEEGTTPVPEEGAGPQNLFLLTVQLFLGLGVVLFLIYAVLKFINKRSRSFSKHQTIQSVGGVGVGQNRSVQLVKVGDKLLVVGVGDTVSLLKEIDDPEEVDNMLRDQERPPVNEAFTRFLSRKEDQTSRADSGSFKDLLSSRMDSVRSSQQKLHKSVKEKSR
ncbi:flagellar biosynthetic protein FliO [Alkalicoccus urumqiensis]|nr:flagellar biosynthetic protein FliO [Alkalicoccus urumqiensis]